MRLKKIWFLFTQFTKYLPLARNYLRKYGIRAALKRAWFTLQSGSFHTGINTFYSLGLSNEFLFRLNPEVILVSNDLVSPSHDYRIGNFANALWETEICATIVTVSEIENLIRLPRKTNLVIFWRTAIVLENLPWYEKAKEEGVCICYDTDDLTFHPEVYSIEKVWALQNIPSETAKFLTGEICTLQYNQVRNSTLAIAATLEMKKYFLDLGTPVIPIPIVVPRWMEKQAIELWQRRVRTIESSEKRFGIRIVYASGSPSHGKDFESCIQGLIQFLTENPYSTLTIIGSPPVSLERFPNSIRKQIEFHQSVQHHELLEALSHFDVQLSPLEVSNSFVEAKSATKFMQGGVIGLPTIASPTEPFLEVIDNYTNGILAREKEEWYEALKYLLKYQNRRDMALSSRESVFSKHTVSNILPAMLEVVETSRNLTKNLGSKETFLGKFESEEDLKKIRVTWLLPDFAEKSGGIQNVLKLSEMLSKRGFACEVVFHNSQLSTEELSRRVESSYFTPSFGVANRINLGQEPDIVVSVHHSSVEYMRSFSPRKAKMVYLVQDFEPFFYPMSQQYLQALFTYFDKEIEIVTSLEWMSRKIEDVTGRKVPFLDFPMNREIYRNRNVSYNERSGVIAYARDDTPRRLFGLMVQSLELVQNIRPDLSITFFGGGNTPHELKNIKNLGIIETNHDLSKLYCENLVGIAFGPTNPSGIPYEMMSCGLPVVDVIAEDGKISKYSGEHPELCLPTVSSVAQRVLHLTNDRLFWIEEQRRGLKLTASMDSEELISSKLALFLERTLEVQA
jgi:glycosyltransferase involved in cell wall biosynthesis